MKSDGGYIICGQIYIERKIHTVKLVFCHHHHFWLPCRFIIMAELNLNAQEHNVAYS